MDTTITRRSALRAAIAMSIVAATPCSFAVPVVHARQESSLTDLPTLAVTIGDTDIAVSPAEISAGRYLITVTNENTTFPESLYAAFMQMGGEATLEALNEALNDPESEGPPDWYYTAWSPGGISVAPGTTGLAVIDLPEGEYAIHPDQGGADVSGTLLKVTGEVPADLPEIPATLSLTMAEMSFTFDPAPTTGAHWLEIVNTGSQPHFAAIFSVPEGTTPDDFLTLMASFQGPPAASPAAMALSFEDLIGLADTSIQSPATTMWTELVFEAGTYLIVCFVLDLTTGMPHAMEGMVDIFVIA